MPPLQVRDCPEDVYERLRVCAAEENRSIANQALTIIQDYLDARKAGQLDAMRVPGRAGVAVVRRSAKGAEVDYAERHRRVFERITSRPPIPVSEDRPRADVMLAQIREEEAR